MSDLRDELTDIRGIGPTKTDAIMVVLDDHDGVSDELAANVREAHDHLEADKPGHAEKFLRRALEEL